MEPEKTDGRTVYMMVDIFSAQCKVDNTVESWNKALLNRGIELQTEIKLCSRNT